ncbi:MAG: lipopolysaccharide heptosyltransferase II [Ignavibacteria bacterium]|nr:lipopolysaccharide heptosyltransferase II [Ignavibacteria bacterium]
MQSMNDVQIFPSSTLHASVRDVSLLKEHVQAHIKPGNRILILALSGIGDALMFTPALNILKRSFPEHHFDVLTMFKGIADILSSNRDVSQVIYHDFLTSSIFNTLQLLMSLRGTYSHTITAFPANRFHYAIVARLIGSRFRIGHRYLHDSISQLNALNNILLNEVDELHNCEENIRIASTLGATIPDSLPPMMLPLSRTDASFAHEWLTSRSLQTNANILGIHAGSATVKNQIQKRWSAEHYAEICAMASRELAMNILLFGGPEERTLNEQITSKILQNHPEANVHIVEKASLSQSIAIMSHCSAFISNDSGLMHCAAALQLPMIAIFGYTSHIHTAPWLNSKAIVARRDLSCSPCFYFSPKPASCQFEGTESAFTCIRDIQPQDIFRYLKQLIEQYKV